MQLKLSEIVEVSAIQKNLSHNFYDLSEIEYEDSHIGKGAVGSVYKVISIDGLVRNGLLLKIVSEADFVDKAYETIKLLHTKINHYQAISGTPIFSEMPELSGLPFIAFKSKSEPNGEKVTGFIMNDLVENDFNDFGAESWNKQNYITKVGFEEKLYLCYQFARGVNFLHEQKFIHADLKDYSIFINTNRPQLTIIDYDGGYHFDKQPFALTLGAITTWASSNWRKLIGQGKSAKDVSIKERLDEENWVLASGLFELLFGVPPYYYLKSIEGDSISNYLKSNVWPAYKDNSDEINYQNIEYLKVIAATLDIFNESGLKSLVDAFYKVFNKGHNSESNRLTPKEWKKLLFDLNKQFNGAPKISKFQSNKSVIHAKNELVGFTWSASFYRAIYIDDILQDPLKYSALIGVQDAKEVTLKVINDFGESIEKIKIDAEKVDPVIHQFESNISVRKDLSPVILKWSTTNCSSVSIEKVGEDFPVNGSVEVNPFERIRYKFTAHGFFDQKVNAEIEIDVELAKITSFGYEINIERGIDNIDIYWQTENTIEVEIIPLIGKVDLSGETHVGIKDKTEFTIKVKGLFNTLERTIDTQPFPIPIIKGLFVPSPVINSEAVISEKLLKIPENIEVSLNKSFSDKLNFSISPPDFVSFNSAQLVKNTIQERIKSSNGLLSLFNNLFKRINKN